MTLKPIIGKRTLPPWTLVSLLYKNANFHCSAHAVLCSIMYTVQRSSYYAHRKANLRESSEVA